MGFRAEGLGFEVIEGSLWMLMRLVRVMIQNGPPEARLAQFDHTPFLNCYRDAMQVVLALLSLST